MHVRDEKQRIRDAVKERLARVSDTARHAESRTLCKQLLRILPQDAFTLTAYYPLKDEPDLRLLLGELMARGCRVFLPRFEGKTMVYRQTVNLFNLPPGTFKIPEPLPDAALLDPKALDVALIPGRAFTRDGRRVGRGNGGFDIWIAAQRAANPGTRILGVCFECQIVNDIPVEPHDQAMDAVVTARGRTEN
jgi:5-formyltetrahydrofolate cyclo-ligase